MFFFVFFLMSTLHEPVLFRESSSKAIAAGGNNRLASSQSVSGGDESDGSYDHAEPAVRHIAGLASVHRPQSASSGRSNSGPVISSRAAVGAGSGQVPPSSFLVSELSPLSTPGESRGDPVHNHLPSVANGRDTGRSNADLLAEFEEAALTGAPRAARGPNDDRRSSRRNKAADDGVERTTRLQAAPDDCWNPSAKDIARDHKQWAEEAEHMRVAATASSGGEGPVKPSSYQKKKRIKLLPRFVGLTPNREVLVHATADSAGNVLDAVSSSSEDDDGDDDKGNVVPSIRQDHVDKVQEAEERRIAEAKRVLQAAHTSYSALEFPQNDRSSLRKAAAATRQRLKKYQSDEDDLSSTRQVAAAPRVESTAALLHNQKAATEATWTKSGPPSYQRDTRASQSRRFGSSNQPLNRDLQQSSRKAVNQKIAFVVREVPKNQKGDSSRSKHQDDVIPVAAHFSSDKEKLSRYRDPSPFVQAAIAEVVIPVRTLTNEIEQERRRLATEYYAVASRRQAQQWQQRADGCGQPKSATASDEVFRAQHSPNIQSNDDDSKPHEKHKNHSDEPTPMDYTNRLARGEARSHHRFGSLSASPPRPSSTPLNAAGDQREAADAFHVWNLLRAFRADKSGSML